MQSALTGKILALSLFWMLSSSVNADTSPQPNTQYQPDEVVKIVVEALRTNTERQNDEGIATVFRFASPGNRANTGPLSRFTNMIKRGFGDMLNFIESRYDPIQVQGNRAVQAVWLRMPDGRELGYAFQMGKQQSGEYADMWMTEGVVPLGRGPKSGTRI